ncbi:energy transducer TonB [Massilia sp. CF038]|uniref:energy transducer TonB n=1 Tax=Massilia sp. CF038 TaxID=1881045 RepID=UPI000915AC37|nr:energy transducer TonB [Massilia sp. CF038]SHH11587.1 Cell division and transport-associated protein TolA [Massilia sp. CF038]
MNPAAAGGAPYTVPPEPSRTPSIMLALAMHALLLVFLYIGVRWQNTEPNAVEAEVWDMKTQEAAPPPPPQPEPVVKPEPIPEPPPPKPVVEEPVAPKAPDIALEKIKEQKKKLLEKKLADEKLAQEKLREELKEEKLKELADKKAKAAQALADQKKLDKLREAETKRMMANLGGTGTAAQSSAPRIDTGYAAAVSGKIKRSTSYVGDTDVPGNPAVQFKIDQLPTGEIISVRKVKSSGIPAFDAAVERGINNSSPLPKKKDGTVDRTVDVTIKMKDVE